MLKIFIEQQKDGTWLADSVNLPGIPPVGRGESLLEAVGSLVVGLASTRSYREHHNISIVSVELFNDYDKQEYKW